MKNSPALKNSPPPQPGSLTEYGSSGSPKANAQHAMRLLSATHWSLATDSKPKANPSKTTNSSTPTNAPTTSPKLLEPTTASQTSRPCVIASPWPAESGHTSPKASPTHTSSTAACDSPAQAAKH